MLYSQTTHGFYDPAINTMIPADAIAITVDEHAALLDGQSAGHIISADQNGRPILSDPASPTLDELKAAKVAELSTACQAQIYAGFPSSALGTAHTYPAKDHDQANLSGSVVASLLPNLPTDWSTPFWCADEAGTWAFVNHTAAQIQQVGVDGKAAILAALAKNAQLAAQVMAATDEASVAAVVW